MLNDQRIPNDAMTNTDVRRPHWSLGFGHSLVIGHWSLVIQRTVRDSSSSSSSSLPSGRERHWSLGFGHSLVIGYLSLVIQRTLLFSALLAAAPAPAQPVPKLTSISPEWIQRGTTAEVVFAGENLGNVTRFIFTGEPGLTATNVPPPVAPKPVVTIESDLGGITRVDPPPM